MQKIIFVLSLIASASADYTDKHADIKNKSLEFEKRIQTACGLPVRVDLSDFMFFMDEIQAFESFGLEHTQHLISALEDACGKHESNRAAVKTLGGIVVKRGSLDERRAFLDKNKNLIYLAARDVKQPGESLQKLQREDLGRILKLDFTPPAKAPDPKAAARDLALKERDRKIKELSAWLQSETQKLVRQQPADLSQRIDELTKQYEGKLDAIIKEN